MKKILSNKNGFSLVELMVAVAVTGLLMAGIFGVLSTSILSFQNTADQGANVQLARSALSEIANELRNATNITVIATNPANLTYSIDSQPHQIQLSSKNVLITKNGVTSSIGQGRINSLEIIQKDATNPRVFTVSIVVQSSVSGAVPTPVTTVITTLN